MIPKHNQTHKRNKEEEEETAFLCAYAKDNGKTK